VKASGEVLSPDPLDNGDDPVPLDVEARDFRAFRRQDMRDLPAEVRTMNACAAVLMYTMLGISDREIMLELRLTDDQLLKVREHEVYALMFEACTEELINVNSMSLQSRIAGMAHGALTRVHEISRKAKKDETRLMASNSILDRAGTKFGDQAERSKGSPVGLRIVVTKENDTTIEVSNVNIGV